MKILELTNYSSGICGVWARVKEEANRLSKNHEVMVFSSDRIKGENGTAISEEKIGKVKIKRFKAKNLGGESFMSWAFEKEAIKFHPDIIIAHSYRHIHTLRALLVARKIKARVFLVTHAPFERTGSRGQKGNIIVYFYDQFVGRITLSKFNKVLSITKWEKPHLLNLGLSEKNISYIPNGIPEEFFTQKRSKEENRILFLGRIAPIKNLEVLIKSVQYIENKKIKLELVGPEEKEYSNFLKKLVKDLNLSDRIIFSKPIYKTKEKIEKIDSARIFVLPSKSEGMSQSLIEAMAREKIVIASDNKASTDLIEDGKNGLIFSTYNEKDLAEKINKALSGKLNNIRKEAKKSVEKFDWKEILKKIEDLLGP
ncbi:hypothetical protein AUJ84_02010 [Candidatus Pacearchaeota archaeon CG1_02_32_132]|nr:MAG: hypothetical protein AUJ84_02010 [Candidatus Pacearchaeota archaeon CG1_02_32_132]